MKDCARAIVFTAMLLGAFSCHDQGSSNKEMIDLLSNLAKESYSPKNNFCPEAKLPFLNSIKEAELQKFDGPKLAYSITSTLLEIGDEKEAISTGYNFIKTLPAYDTEYRMKIRKNIALAYLRIGEKTNCVNNHSGESCIFPIMNKGVHTDKSGSQQAIKIYEEILAANPEDLESRWLLNIAYMTIGGYPQMVPPKYLIEGLGSDSKGEVKPFTDMAMSTGLGIKNLSGGSIIEDFNNDGYLDVVTSSWSLSEGMHYLVSNHNGTFADMSEKSGLAALTGGLNIMQTDYNNDGLKDIFVLRGAWLGEFGKQPNSLLKNNGDGTFSDVTVQSGLLSFHPTGTATWADFNQDGWLDIFIGNESTSAKDIHPCELYLSNKDGTFKNVAAETGCDVTWFVKGVTSGDYNNDGYPDIFISTLNGKKLLLKNETVKNGAVRFRDETIVAGLNNNTTQSFPTWFWDYDNDGWLDILVAGYEFNKALSWYVAGEALGMPASKSGRVFLFRNNQDGTFSDASDEAGLKKLAFAMGSNFGDIDNDGYLDIYMGTGNPAYESLVPNKMFKNVDGKKFIDVTSAARVGNLQKGHGVSFADLDNDGDQDIHIEMGGAFPGDGYQSSLYINPGQNKNHWIKISLKGASSNAAAIGARIKVTFEENGVTRSVYRDVNSGGSFGANPLLQHIGIGQAKSVQRIEIKWPGAEKPQTFENIAADLTVTITQDSDQIQKARLNIFDFSRSSNKVIGCSPF